VKRRAALILLFTFIGLTSLGQGTNGLPPGMVRLRVGLSPEVGEDIALLSRQLSGMVRGRIEQYSDAGFVGFVMIANASAADITRRDPRVISVETLDRGHATLPEPPQIPAPMPGPTNAAPQLGGRITTNSSAFTTGSATFTIGGYTYDGAGNIKTIGADLFHYDHLGRLKEATVAGLNEKYTYDGFGNRKAVTTNGGTINVSVSSATNRLTSQPATIFGQHDLAGRLTSYLNRDTFTYDELDMVKEWNDNVGRKVYLYTANDERIGMVMFSGGAETTSEWTIRDPSHKVLRVYSKSMVGGERWTWKEDYIYREGQLLAAAIDGPARTLHFHLDHLGTPRLITGNGGATVAKHTYHPFGTEITSSGQDTERMKFTGHERDFPSGMTTDPLDYMHARYYSPGAGRFLSVDPAGFDPSQPQSWNRYSYVQNNPVNRFDPDGREMHFMDYVAGISAGLADTADDVAYSTARPALQVMAGLMNDSPRQIAAGVTEIALLAVAPEVTKAAGNAVSGFLARRGAQQAAAEAVDAAVAEIRASPGRKPATIIGASQPETGQVVVGRSSPGAGGCCAEVDAARKLGGDPKKIQFSKPIRPRTGEVIEVCGNCKKLFDPTQFPKGTPIEP
jgi:RHS repeat-associated protein